jgi:hypothetical protein
VAANEQPPAGRATAVRRHLTTGETISRPLQGIAAYAAWQLRVKGFVSVVDYDVEVADGVVVSPSLRFDIGSPSSFKCGFRTIGTAVRGPIRSAVK